MSGTIYIDSSEKAWATLRAAAALRGVTLHRTDPADGPVRVFAVGSAAHAHLLSDAEVTALLGAAPACNQCVGW